jgi:hypothetical protein
MWDARALHDGSPVGGVAVCKVASRRNGNAGAWLGLQQLQVAQSTSVVADGPTPFDVGFAAAVNAGTARGFPGFPRDLQRVSWLARTQRHS